MRTILKKLLFAILSIIIISCANDNKDKTSTDTDVSGTSEQKISSQEYEGDKLVVTDKIMYDVQIVNDIIGDRSKESPDWFWENLPTPDSDNFIKQLLVDAASGKLKTYYYDMTGTYESFDQIPQSEIKAYMDNVLNYKIEIVDTTVKRYKPKTVTVHLNHKNVKKLRFLEEWYIGDGVFHKRVIAVAPYFTIEYPGMKTVNAVYFWIMINQ